MRRLEHERAELHDPVFALVKLLEKLLIEVVQPLLRFDPVRHVNEIETVHQLPLFRERAFLMDSLIDRRPRERRELGHVHIVKFQTVDEVCRHFYCLFGLARKAHHEQALGPDASLLDELDRGLHFVEIDLGLVARQDLGGTRLDAEAYHPAARGLEHLEQRVVDMPHAHGTVIGHAERLLEQEITEFLYSLAVERE